MRSLCLAILCSLLGTTVSIEPTATQVFWLTCRVFISYARMVCIVRDVWCGVKLKRGTTVGAEIKKKNKECDLLTLPFLSPAKGCRIHVCRGVGLLGRGVPPGMCVRPWLL